MQARNATRGARLIGAALLGWMLLGPSAPASAQLGGIGNKVKAAVGGSTKKFISSAVKDKLVDTQLGQLGQNRAKNPLVRRFAEGLTATSRTQTAQLDSLAQKKGVQAPTDAGDESKTEVNKLQGLSGDSFDKSFLSAVAKRKASQLVGLQREASAGQDTDTKSWAQKAIPVEKQIMAKAHELTGKL